MAYTMKDVFYLDTSIATTTSAGDGIATLDLSSYVDPIARGRSKGQGLAIYKVHLMFLRLQTMLQPLQPVMGRLEPV